MSTSDTQTGALSPDDFIRDYSIGRTKLYEELAAGRLKARKFGRRTLILRSDAERWAASLPELAAA